MVFGKFRRNLLKNYAPQFKANMTQKNHTYLLVFAVYPAYPAACDPAYPVILL